MRSLLPTLFGIFLGAASVQCQSGCVPVGPCLDPLIIRSSVCPKTTTVISTVTKSVTSTSATTVTAESATPSCQARYAYFRVLDTSDGRCTSSCRATDLGINCDGNPGFFYGSEQCIPASKFSPGPSLSKNFFSVDYFGEPGENCFANFFTDAKCPGGQAKKSYALPTVKLVNGVAKASLSCKPFLIDTTTPNTIPQGVTFTCLCPAPKKARSLFAREDMSGLLDGKAELEMIDGDV